MAVQLPLSLSLAHASARDTQTQLDEANCWTIHTSDICAKIMLEGATK